MKRYEISPEGLGEINIEIEHDGAWVEYSDVEALEKERDDQRINLQMLVSTAQVQNKDIEKLEKENKELKDAIDALQQEMFLRGGE